MLQIEPVEFEAPQPQPQPQPPPPRPEAGAGAVAGRTSEPAEWEVPAPQGGAPAWPGLSEEEERQEGTPPSASESLQEESKRSFQQYRGAARGISWRHSCLIWL